MSLAVLLYLDKRASRIVEEAQTAIDEAGLSPGTRIRDFPPHISLAICEKLDMDGFERYLRRFAAATPVMKVSFPRLETFPTDPAVLFLEPGISVDLVAAHQRFHAGFQQFAEEPSEYYLPGQWVPHCTLAERLSPADVVKAVKLCRDLSLPLRARLEEVAVVELDPARLHYSFKLPGY